MQENSDPSFVGVYSVTKNLTSIKLENHLYHECSFSVLPS
eukprot:UN20111